MPFCTQSRGSKEDKKLTRRKTGQNANRAVDRQLKMGMHKATGERRQSEHEVSYEGQEPNTELSH